MPTLDLQAFLSQPYRKQLHVCAMLWLRNQHIAPFANGKLVSHYFRCRAFLFKLERQYLKNIAIMLDATVEPVPLFRLPAVADSFIQSQRSLFEDAKCSMPKAYDIDFKAFLSPVEPR